MRKPSRQSGTRRSKVKRQVPHGRANIKSTFNNTIVTIADPQGNVLCWASGGTVGFTGTKKGTPFAAQLASESAGHYRRRGWKSSASRM